MSPTQVLSSGPWTGVLDTTDPYDDSPDKLVNASNGYFIDTRTPGGFYGRPGVIQGPGSVSSNGARSCLYNFAVSDGTYLRFFACKGKLYRITTSGTSFTTLTDVTPVGVTISATDGTTSGGPTTRYYMTQLAGQLVFTDGINRPWLGTNLTSTPITGTYIDADGLGSAWIAQGAPTIAQGSILFLVSSPPSGSSVQAGVGFMWSEPNQPATGYVQTNYTDFFNYVQTGSEPLYAVLGTNEGLVLFRERSIGLASGPLNSLSSSPTVATIAYDVGTRSPAAIATFGNNIFFVDRLGRPYMMQMGYFGIQPPTPIWEQMRGQYDRNHALQNYPAVIGLVAQAVVVPTLKVVLIAPYSPYPTGNGGNLGPIQPTTAFAFDAESGSYCGTWALRDGTPTIEAMAVMTDGNNNPTLAIITNTNTGNDLTTWFNIQNVPSAGKWYDTDQNGVNTTMTPSVTTGRLGYSESATWGAREAFAVVMSSSAVSLTVTTPYNSATSQGTVTPPSSDDSTYRVQFGLDVRAARGMQFTLTPSTLTNQWGIQRLAVPASPSKAVPGEA